MDPRTSGSHEPPHELDLSRSIEAGLRVADALVRLGDRERALDMYLQVAERYVGAGRALEAVAVGFRALALDPVAFSSTRVAGLLRELGDAAIPLCQRAAALLREKHPHEAMMLAELMLVLEPSNLQARRNLAEPYAETGKREEAIALLESTCRRLDPVHSAPRNTPRDRELIVTARLLLRLDPTHAGALRRLTHACLRIGQPAAALATAARLVSSTSEDPDAMELLALVYIELDRPKETLGVLRRLMCTLSHRGPEHAARADLVLARAHGWCADDGFHRGVAHLRVELRKHGAESDSSEDRAADDPLAAVPDAPELLANLGPPTQT
jgi:tetratricopeptide (TPR) repeat protein